MPTRAPQTKADEIFGKINALLSDATRYMSADEWDIRRLRKDAEELVKVHAQEGHSAIASTYELCGDIESALTSINKAIALDSDPIYQLNKVSLLCNLGFFSDAQALFGKAAEPRKSAFTRFWGYGYACAAFKVMTKHLEEAKRMHISLEGLETETAIRASRLMDRTGVEDSEIAAVLDVVGRSMRERKLFYLGLMPEVNVFDEPDREAFIRIAYDFEISPSEAHSFYLEVVDRVMEDLPKAPSILSISIRSLKRSHERNAA